MNKIFLSVMVASSALGAQESASDRGVALFVEGHQVTPSDGLRATNSRGGWGGMVGVQGRYARFVFEASGVPTQTFTLNGLPTTTTVATWGYGLDGILPIKDTREAAVYLLGGLHLDKWSWETLVHDSLSSSEESDQSAHLGLRLGVGLRLGRAFGEVRYRVTEGDLRVPSYLQGRGTSWSAVEVGLGVRF